MPGDVSPVPKPRLRDKIAGCGGACGVSLGWCWLERVEGQVPRISPAKMPRVARKANVKTLTTTT